VDAAHVAVIMTPNQRPIALSLAEAAEQGQTHTQVAHLVLEGLASLVQAEGVAVWGLVVHQSIMVMPVPGVHMR
jgi:hypothetical protein